MTEETRRLSGRKVLVGITGGIAAYKAATLVSHLRKEGAEVQVVMTEHAAEFIAPMTLLALSGRPVRIGMFDPRDEANVQHISLADWADVCVVAPVTANAMAKMAWGLADDLLSTILLATTVPVLLAPAMNVHMWDHPATQRNLSQLLDWGSQTIGPDEGDLACGYQGRGRMAEPEAILERIVEMLAESGK